MVGIKLIPTINLSYTGQSFEKDPNCIIKLTYTKHCPGKFVLLICLIISEASLNDFGRYIGQFMCTNNIS